MSGARVLSSVVLGALALCLLSSSAPFAEAFSPSAPQPLGALRSLALSPSALSSSAFTPARVRLVPGTLGRAQPLSSSTRRQAAGAASQWKALDLKFFQAEEVKVNWNRPNTEGNFGAVFYGQSGGQPIVIKCPVLEDFSLKIFDTERAVNIKLSAAIGDRSVPWTRMIGEVTVPETTSMRSDLARSGIVWQKEGDGSTLEDYLSGGKDLYRLLGVRERPNSKIRVELATNVMGQLLIALEQIQEKGIMHRDIKPSNTLVVPEDKVHPLKIIDFGSCCDFRDPLLKGVGDATNDPMYAPPEQTITFTAPGKFDTFSIGMTGIRVLFPSLTRDGVSSQWPGGNFQRFGLQELPDANYDLKKWMKTTAESNAGKISDECEEALQPENAQLIELLQSMINKRVLFRTNAGAAIQKLGPEWVARQKGERIQKQDAEQKQKQEVDRRKREAAQRAEAEAKELKAAEERDSRLKKQAEERAVKASQEEEQRLKAQQAQQPAVGSGRQGGLFGGRQKSQQNLKDDDIANVVPADWRESQDYFKSPRLSFKQGEIVVAFRSDGSRRFGKIMQDNGDGTYDILVERFGGQGAGQFRTDKNANIGKLSTGRTLNEELEADRQSADRQKRLQRKSLVAKIRLGTQIPQEWQNGEDYAFSPTSFFKSGEAVVAARPDGVLVFAKVNADRGDGTFELDVGKGKRVYFVGSIGKVITI